jgi:hypothetical protein
MKKMSETVFEVENKFRKNGDYVNRYYYKKGSSFIRVVQKYGTVTVADEYVEYDNPEEAQAVFNNY